jgi:hypothetical protein
MKAWTPKVTPVITAAGGPNDGRHAMLDAT